MILAAMAFVVISVLWDANLNKAKSQLEALKLENANLREESCDRGELIMRLSKIITGDAWRNFEVKDGYLLVADDYLEKTSKGLPTKEFRGNFLINLRLAHKSGATDGEIFFRLDQLFSLAERDVYPQYGAFKRLIEARGAEELRKELGESLLK
jgi:hypothetical protein